MTDDRKRASSVLSGYPRGNGQQRDQRSHQGLLTDTDVATHHFYFFIIDTQCSICMYTKCVEIIKVMSQFITDKTFVLLWE